MKLRRAVPADAAAIGALHVASWRETYAGLVPNRMLAALSVEARTAMWNGVLDDPSGGTAVFVTEDAGRIVGFGACGGQRDDALLAAGFSGEIGAIYVLGTHQGRGLGRSIMAATAQLLTDRGQSALSLWVLRGNAPARAFYARLGGEMVGEKTDEGLVEVAYGWRDLSRLTG